MRDGIHTHRCGICHRFTRCESLACDLPYELPCLEKCSVADVEPLSVTPIVARFLRQPRPMTRRTKLAIEFNR